MSFSDRIGKTKPKTLLQVDAMDDDLRNGLWEACIQYELDAPFQDLIRGLYVNFFKRPTDTIPDGSYRNIGAIRDWFFKANWFDVYNFIEYLLQKDAGNFSKRISFFLEREKSAYRVINRQLVPITEPIEIAAVSAATLVPERFAGARVHMQTAIQLYSQKPEPDYRNAVKEAISAVETVAKVITGDPKATLGDALKKISEKMPLHPAMREAMTKLYGYTSDEGGIRHAMLEESKIDDAEAKFMIVACSAFVNLCVQRSSGLDH